MQIEGFFQPPNQPAAPQLRTTTQSSNPFAELIHNPQQPQQPQNQFQQPPYQQPQQQQPFPSVQNVHSNPFAGKPGPPNAPSPVHTVPTGPVAPVKPIFAGQPAPITPAPVVSWTTPSILYPPTTPAYVPPTQG